VLDCVGCPVTDCVFHAGDDVFADAAAGETVGAGCGIALVAAAGEGLVAAAVVVVG
jgi:hypothetical protein